MHIQKRISEPPLQYKRKYVNNKEAYELILPEKEQITSEINTHMLDVVRNKKNIGEIVEYSNVEYTYTFINKYYGDYIFIKKEVNNATIR